MFSYRIYLKIFFNILLILLLCGGGILLIVFRWAIIIGIFLLIWAILQTRYLVNSINFTNKRIAFFFDTIKDNGTQSYYPEENVSREEQLMNHTFNRINRIIAENKLQNRKQELFYKALLEHIPSGILAWDTRGKILLANRAALHLLGFNSLHQTRQIEEKFPEFRQVTVPQDTRTLSDIRIETGQGYRQLALVRSYMAIQEQQVTLLSLQDIREQLDEKESESWIRLTHVLTHEIMNSIAPITSLSETLSSYFETDGIAKNKDELTQQTIQKTIKGLSIMKRRGKSLLHFAESYRKLTFIPSPVIRSFPFTELADHLHHLFQTELVTRNIRLEIGIVPLDLTVDADEELLSQVIINLFKNALQALEGRTGGILRLDVRRESGQTLIELTDNGQGIPPEILKDIFVPFFTTKSSGSGIGLSFSRQIIHLHGGELTATSIPGQETRFSISLPIREKQ